MREFDVVVFGATGFTGRLVAEYLLEHHAELRLALAGRSASKLEAVRGSIAERLPAAATVPLVVADSTDPASLAAMVTRTTVLCTTVGPYAKYGHPVARACAEAGTHCCDLTGEPPFVRESIDRYSAIAAETGARIVHCCGFDSIPSDIGTWMLQQEALARFGRPLDRVRFALGRTRGGASGGTIASMLHIAERATRDPDVRRTLTDPYSLNPDGERRGPDGMDPVAVRWNGDLGGWQAPFVMAGINSRVVRRTNAVLGYPYGREFRYSEVVSTGPGLSGLRRAVGMGAVFASLALAAVAPGRALIRRLTPATGDGPTAEERAAGHFTVHLKGWGVDRHGAAVTLEGRVQGFADPGYGETAKMLGESATCLALDDLSVGGGVWTPASAMGDALLDRLRGAGMVFDVEAVG